MLVEYYKFHKDIPRIYTLPSAKALNKYYGKRRKLEFVRIRKLLDPRIEK